MKSTVIPHLIGIHRKHRIWEPELFSTSPPNGPVQFFADGETRPDLKALNDNIAGIKKAVAVANKRNINPVIHLPYSIRFDNFRRPFFRAYIDKIIKISKLFTAQSYIIMHLWPGGKSEKLRVKWIVEKFPKRSQSGKSNKKNNDVDKQGQYPILVFENMINFTSASSLGDAASALRNTGAKFCIDTAHVWGGGVDIRTVKKAKQYLRDLERLKVPIAMFHLNPPAKPFGDIIDRHGDMDKTQMLPEVMNVFVEYAAKHNDIIIIERPSLVNVIDITDMWKTAIKK